MPARVELAGPPAPVPEGLADQPTSKAASEAVKRIAKLERSQPPPSLPAPSPPKACRTIPAAPTDDRIALILRGEAFRGLHEAVDVDEARANVETRVLRRGLVCAPHSRAWQRAISKAHVARIVEPLEANGLTVDVVLASPGCAGAPRFSNATAQRWWAELEAIYGPRVVASTPQPPGLGQGEAVRRAVDALLALGRGYRSARGPASSS